MTTELPRVSRSGAPAPAAQAPEQAAPPAPAAPQARPTTPPAQSRQRYADETMELPIFRELESAWFRTRRPGTEEETPTAAAKTPTSGAPTQQFARVDAGGRAVQPTSPGTTGNAPMADTPAAGGAPRENGPTANEGGRSGVAGSFGHRRPSQQQTGGWQTSADDGWRAASAATEVPVVATTTTGLPKRTPMAQLVPGAVEKPAASVQRRTPEGVRGLLSAYHRGVQRGRTNPSDSNPTNPEAAPGGQQSSQSGSGPMAGSGQKEQER